MKEYVINKNDSGQRLDKYITKSFPLLPQSLMYKYIRSKRIKVNGKRSEISYRLKENDVITIEYANRNVTVRVLKVPTGNVSVQEAPTLYEVVE